MEHPNLVIDLCDVLKLICIDAFSRSLAKAIILGCINAGICVIWHKTYFVELYFIFTLNTISIFHFIVRGIRLLSGLMVDIVIFVFHPLTNYTRMDPVLFAIDSIGLFIRFARLVLIIGCEATVLVCLKAHLMAIVWE